METLPRGFGQGSNLEDRLTFSRLHMVPTLHQPRILRCCLSQKEFDPLPRFLPRFGRSSSHKKLIRCTRSLSWLGFRFGPYLALSADRWCRTSSRAAQWVFIETSLSYPRVVDKEGSFGTTVGVSAGNLHVADNAAGTPAHKKRVHLASNVRQRRWRYNQRDDRKYLEVVKGKALHHASTLKCRSC